MIIMVVVIIIPPAFLIPFYFTINREFEIWLYYVLKRFRSAIIKKICEIHFFVTAIDKKMYYDVIDNGFQLVVRFLSRNLKYNLWGDKHGRSKIK